MKARLIEFKQELCETDLEPYSDDSLSEWFKEWKTYILKGGVRPGHPH